MLHDDYQAAAPPAARELTEIRRAAEAAFASYLASLPPDEATRDDGALPSAPGHACRAGSVGALTFAPLAYVRRRAGLSRQQLADAAGISARQLLRIEEGRSEPLLRTMVALAWALADAEGKPHREAEREIAALWRSR